MTKEKAKTMLIVIMIAVTAYVMRDAWLPGVINAVWNQSAVSAQGQGQQPAQTWAVATPTLAQFAPTAEPLAVATAVPVFGGVAESAPVIVAATAVPPRVDVAAAAGAAMLHITAGGREYNLTGERLVDCINAQENGQRTGPTCPPNAKQYAGMLGQGR